MMFKRGYEKGEKVIEIHEGNVDVVIYHENNTGSFYFYRFSSAQVFGERISKDLSIYGRNSVKSFLADYDRDYDSTLMELVEDAVENKKSARYDM